MPFETAPMGAKRIAVIGGGISGMGAAYELRRAHQVVLFEAAPRLGGHARTVMAGKNGDLPVDTGFLVFNDVNYPHLIRLFKELDVPVMDSDMSFGASIDGGWLEYGLLAPRAVFAQPRNLVRPKFYGMIRDILKFNKRANSELIDPAITIGELVNKWQLGDWFRDYYLTPFTGAIWSTPITQICIFCVVDLHAITVRQDPKELKNNIRETVATFVASGIDSKKSIIFNQSSVAAHAEGACILSCIARMGWLNRMTQFKEKAGKDKEKASIGLYSYPVLMAADILLYDATHVPVGDDQKQHLELCRDIAQKFNNDFDVENFLQVPEPLIQKEFSRIMSLKDGSKKMSKSELSDLSRINLTDEKDQIINKIKKAKTDPLPMPQDIKELDERLEARNLLGIYSSLTNSTLQNSVKNFSGKNFSEFKEQLAEEVVNKIEPISNEIKKLLEDKKFLDEILLDGVEKANTIASKKIERIKEIVGF